MESGSVKGWRTNEFFCGREKVSKVRRRKRRVGADHDVFATQHAMLARPAENGQKLPFTQPHTQF